MQTFYYVVTETVRDPLTMTPIVERGQMLYAEHIEALIKPGSATGMDSITVTICRDAFAAQAVRRELNT